jgi:hypothetical protein
MPCSLQDWLSVKHPSFKQKRCPLEDLDKDVLKKCNKPIDRRVTFEMSDIVYSSLSKHLPVGSGLFYFVLNLPDLSFFSV